MNERIRLLAEQAGMTDDKYGMFFAKDFDSHCADGVDLEKFAELIVEEMYVFMCNATDNDKSWPTFKEVKQHFGVE